MQNCAIVSDEVCAKSVGTNTDFVCTCYKNPEIMLNIPGQMPLPGILKM